MGLQATNAGINFQQRVSAYMMILMEFDMDISLVLQLNENNKIKSINFEACESIDDLVLELDSNKKIYFQTKRTISLSNNINSEFYSVCKQFVKQYLNRNEDDIAYILATRSEASNSITVKLKRVLEGIHLAKTLRIIDDLNQEEKNTYSVICNNIKAIYKNIKNEEMSDDELLDLLLRIYIEIFDIENGEEYEKTIKIILYNQIGVNVDLFWNTLISKAVEYGSNRRLLSKEALKEQCKAYLEDKLYSSSEPRSKEQFLEMAWKDELPDPEIQIDYVIAVPTEATKTIMLLEKETVFIFELYRFDNSKKKESLKYFSPNIMKWKNGFEFEVWFRCSTQERCYKYLNEHLPENKNDQYEVVVWPVKEHFDCSDVEQLHKDVLIKSLEKQNECTCVNCGKAIFDNESKLIEIDNEEYTNMLGLVHNSCIRPVDRVIGEVIIPKIEDYYFLRHFDINMWIKLIKKGKQAWVNIENMATHCLQMIINTDDVFHDGNYCLYHVLENGDKKYTRSRGVIDRVSKRESDRLQQGLTLQMTNAKAEGNPFGYSSVSNMYGQYTQILEQVGDKEDFIECVEVKTDKYNKLVAKMYNDCETYYAPIIYLSVDGDPFFLPNGTFPMITDPFDLPKYIKNWEKLGFSMPNYEVCIIKDDNEFILKMINLITNNTLPVVNGMFDLNGKPIRGVFIRLMWELEQEYTQRMDKELTSKDEGKNKA